MRVHGSDIHQYFAYPDRRRLIVEAMGRSSAVVSVSGALRDMIAGAAVDAGKIHVIYNGLDRGVFRPMDRLAARREAGLDAAAPVILYAGNFERVKGVDLLIEAFGRTAAAAELHIIGDGPEGKRLAGLARALPAGKRAVFHPRVDHRLLGVWFNAADVVCLPSLAEGMPNVVFEALACRTPVVAADTGGIPEVVSANSGALAGALAEALGRPWDRDRIECPAGSWEDNARALGGLLERAARDGAGTGR
jgi:glycosyltransferase involved in cell wall biosynthesis